MILPAEATDRKNYPIATGVIDFFPRTFAQLAHLSYVGCERHSPGMGMCWDRNKSPDHSDAMMRHFVERNTIDVNGTPHCVQMTWRACAFTEIFLEQQAEVIAAVSREARAASGPLFNPDHMVKIPRT